MTVQGAAFRHQAEIKGMKDVTRVDEVAERYRRFRSIKSGLILSRMNDEIAKRLARMVRAVLISNAKRRWN